MSYLCTKLHPCFRRNRIVSEAQCYSMFQWRRCHRKTVNVFGISRASISAIIENVSYAITTFSGAEPIKLPTTENKVKELTNKLLGTREFLQCIGAIHDTHIEIVELNEHCSYYLNKNGYFCQNVQAVRN